jgi:uncharacterized protein YecT (DUF1311 family)
MARANAFTAVSAGDRWTGGVRLRNKLPMAIVTGIALLATSSIEGQAQTRRPTEKEIAAIQECVKQNAATEKAESCIYKLVAEPCSEAEGGSNLGRADCYRVERAIWDLVLNEAYKELQDELQKTQLSKLREMQRAWIAARDRTCEFYHHKIDGSMAVSMSASCLLRETAQRALLLKQFQGL